MMQFLDVEKNACLAFFSFFPVKKQASESLLKARGTREHFSFFLPFTGKRFRRSGPVKKVWHAAAISLG